MCSHTHATPERHRRRRSFAVYADRPSLRRPRACCPSCPAVSHERRSKNNVSRRRVVQRNLLEKVSAGQLFQVRVRDTGVQVQMPAHRHHSRDGRRRWTAGVGIFRFR